LKAVEEKTNAVKSEITIEKERLKEEIAARQARDEAYHASVSEMHAAHMKNIEHRAQTIATSGGKLDGALDAAKQRIEDATNAGLRKQNSAREANEAVAQALKHGEKVENFTKGYAEVGAAFGLGTVKPWRTELLSETYHPYASPSGYHPRATSPTRLGHAPAHLITDPRLSMANARAQLATTRLQGAHETFSSDYAGVPPTAARSRSPPPGVVGVTLNRGYSEAKTYHGNPYSGLSSVQANPLAPNLVPTSFKTEYLSTTYNPLPASTARYPSPPTHRYSSPSRAPTYNPVMSGLTSTVGTGYRSGIPSAYPSHTALGSASGVSHLSSLSGPASAAGGYRHRGMYGHR